MRDRITIARLHEVLICCPDTGRLFHKIDRGGYKAGAEAFTARKGEGRQAYHIGSVDYVLFRRARLVWAMTTGRWPKGLIDHRNNTPYDDRFVNLREATHAQNAYNKKVQPYNLTGVKGVSRRRHKFTGRIMKDGIAYESPRFDTIEEARAWYEAKAIELFGEFAHVE